MATGGGAPAQVKNTDRQGYRGETEAVNVDVDLSDFSQGIPRGGTTLEVVALTP